MVPALVLFTLVVAACSSHIAALPVNSAPAITDRATGGQPSSGILGGITTASDSFLAIDIWGTTHALALRPASSDRPGHLCVVALDLAFRKRVRVRAAASSMAEMVLLLVTGAVVFRHVGGFLLATAQGTTLAVTTASSSGRREEAAGSTGGCDSRRAWTEGGVRTSRAPRHRPFRSPPDGCAHPRRG